MPYRIYAGLLIPIIAILLVTSCNVVNPTEPIPHFVNIDTLTLLETDKAKHGSTKQHKITDVWVYVDNTYIGTYEVPARVPIIAENGQALQLLPGININGVSNNKNEYPFYNAYSTPINWPKGEAKTVMPVYTYNPNATMIYDCDFESSNVFEPKAVGIDMPINYTNNPTEVLEGGASGKLTFDGTQALNTADNITVDYLPLISNKVYFIELDYKCEMPFEVYIVSVKNGTTTSTFLSGVNTRTTWNKIYLNLSPIVTSLKAEGYAIMLKAKLNNGQSTGSMYIDNLKVMTIN
jgi:hypothetical protein